MTSTATAPDAIDRVFGRDELLSWVHEFKLRGRVYTIVHGAGTTHDREGALVRVFAGGRERDIRVRPTDRVTIVSRFKGDGTSYPEGRLDLVLGREGAEQLARRSRPLPA